MNKTGLCGIFLSTCLLSGCNLQETIENIDYESIVDHLFESAVDVLLENDSVKESATPNSINPNHVTPTPVVPSTGTSSTVAEPEPEFYNDSITNAVIHLRAIHDKTVTLEGGWQVSGMLMTVNQLPLDYAIMLRESPEEAQFPFSFFSYNMDGQLILETVDCQGIGTAEDNLDFFLFEYTDGNGELVQRGVGVTEEIYTIYQEKVYFPEEHITVHIPNTATMTDSYNTGISKTYSDIDEYYQYRLDTNSFMNGETVTDLSVTIVNGFVTSVHGIYFG